jgi:cell division protein FtsB
MEIKDRLCSQCVFSKQDITTSNGLYVCDIYYEIILNQQKAVLCPKFIEAKHTADYIKRLNEYASSLESRIAELKAETAELKERVAILDITAVYKSLGEMGYIEQVTNLKAENAALQSRIAKLEAEVEELKPYKYGYSTRKKPKPHEWVIVDYKEHLYFGYYDDDKRWATQYRDNIREGVRRWYPAPVLSEDFDNDPA